MVLLRKSTPRAATEKTRSDGSLVATTANMAFENMGTQLQKELSINVSSQCQSNTQSAGKYGVLLARIATVTCLVQSRRRAGLQKCRRRRRRRAEPSTVDGGGVAEMAAAAARRRRRTGLLAGGVGETRVCLSSCVS